MPVHIPNDDGRKKLMLPKNQNMNKTGNHTILPKSAHLERRPNSTMTKIYNLMNLHECLSSNNMQVGHTMHQGENFSYHSITSKIFLQILRSNGQVEKLGPLSAIDLLFTSHCNLEGQVNSMLVMHIKHASKEHRTII